MDQPDAHDSDEEIEPRTSANRNVLPTQVDHTGYVQDRPKSASAAEQRTNTPNASLGLAYPDLRHGAFATNASSTKAQRPEEHSNISIQHLPIITAANTTNPLHESSSPVATLTLPLGYKFVGSSLPSVQVEPSAPAQMTPTYDEGESRQDQYRSAPPTSTEPIQKSRRSAHHCCRSARPDVEENITDIVKTLEHLVISFRSLKGKIKEEHGSHH